MTEKAKKAEKAEKAKPADRQVGIQKIYVKDFSFESPQSPDIFAGGKDWKPNSNLNLRSAHSQIKDRDDLFEVVLTITVETKQEDDSLFLVEIQQAGVFQIKGYGEEEFGHLVGSYCPSILFPYAREAIANVVSRGGFPEFILQPINFDALYAQTLQQQKGAADQEKH
jgi:preprotein translocase subunit SecB